MSLLLMGSFLFLIFLIFLFSNYIIFKLRKYNYDVRYDVAYQRGDNFLISHVQNIFENYRYDILSVNKIHSKYLDTEDIPDLQRNRCQKNLI